MTRDEAMAFIELHGVVLVSGQGPVPRFTEAVAGGPIKGSWWAHPESHRIFDALQEVTGSGDILVCRLVEGKVTLVHRRLWPALMRVADRFPKGRLAWIRQEHTAEGHHVNREIPFPEWAPADARRRMGKVSETEALRALGDWVLKVPTKQDKRKGGK